MSQPVPDWGAANERVFSAVDGVVKALDIDTTVDLVRRVEFSTMRAEVEYIEFRGNEPRRVTVALGSWGVLDAPKEEWD